MSVLMFQSHAVLIIQDVVLTGMCKSLEPSPVSLYFIKDVCVVPTSFGLTCFVLPDGFAQSIMIPPVWTSAASAGEEQLMLLMFSPVLV